jgi:hypothetical protein
MLANSFEQTIFGEGFRQIFVGTHHSAACTVEQPILAGKHNDGSKLEAGIFFNKRAGLITIKSWHHDVNKNDIGLMIRNLGQRVKTVLSQNDFTSGLQQKNFGATAYGIAVVDNHYFDAHQTLPLAHPCIPLTEFFRATAQTGG